MAGGARRPLLTERLSLAAPPFCPPPAGHAALIFFISLRGQGRTAVCQRLRAPEGTLPPLAVGVA